MTNEHHVNADVASRITARQVDLLYDSQPFALLFTMLVVSLLFGFIFTQENSSSFTICYSLFLVTVLYRSFYCWSYFKDRNNDSIDVSRAKKIYLLGIVISGLAWSLSIWLLFPIVTLKGQIVLLIVVMGVSAAAHTTMGFLREPIISFILLLSVPMAFAIYDVFGFPDSMVIVLAIVIYTMFMLRSSLVFYKSTYSMLSLNEIAIQREKDLEFKTTEANAANMAKSQFLSRMSHELRTPLNAVLGMNELLLQDSNEPLSEKQRDRVSKIGEAGKHLLSIVDDVLDLSCIDTGSMDISLALTDCKAVINDSIKLVENKASLRDVTISTEISQPDIYSMADEKRLKQVVVNLLDNAIKYNKRGGQVSIILNVENDNYVRLSIVDTGYGIPKSSRDKLFLPFSRVNAEHLGVDGTGIGLSLCKQLVKLMDGRIGMECQQGKGCCFWVEIPYVKQTGFIKAEKNKSASEMHMGSVYKSKILLVEDNQVNREVAIDMLKELGYEADVATEGQQALDALETNNYALILMDCEMPIMDGFTATVKIREKEKLLQQEAVIIVALTAHAVTGAKDQCLSSGMDDFLSKPFNMSTLNMMLNKWLRIDGAKEIINRPPVNKSEALKPVTVNDVLSSFDVIDQEVIKRLSSRQRTEGGSLASKVVNIYLVQSSSLLSDMALAVEQSDVEAVRTISHTLKSSSSNVGATGLSDLCKKIEYHCCQGEIETLLVAQLRSTYSEVEKALNDVLDADSNQSH